MSHGQMHSHGAFCRGPFYKHWLRVKGYEDSHPLEEVPTTPSVVGEWGYEPRKKRLCTNHVNFMKSLADDRSWRHRSKLEERLVQYPITGICDLALSVSIEGFRDRVESETTPAIAQDFFNSCQFFIAVSVYPKHFLFDLAAGKY